MGCEGFVGKIAAWGIQYRKKRGNNLKQTINNQNKIHFF